MSALAHFDRFGIPSQAVETGDIITRCSLAIMLNRRVAKPMIAASTEYGIPLREVERTNPRAVHRQTITLSIGLRDYQVRALASGIDLPEEHWESFIELAGKLYTCHLTSDALHSEINPLILYPPNIWIAQDGILQIDPNARFRQPDALLEAPALPNMSYIPLNGSIGCIVNGGGLALTTLDTIQLAGGVPANFLDIGSGSISEKLARACEFLNARQDVRVILVNLFCGVTWCVDVARDFLASLSNSPSRVPLVIRLGGFDIEEAHSLLTQAAVPGLHVAMTLSEAAHRAAVLARTNTG